MRRNSLLVQLLIYVVLVISIGFALIGGIYYKTSSQVIGQLTEQSTRRTIQQGGEFVSTYVQRIKQLTDSLVHSSQIQEFAQEPTSTKQEEIKHLLQTILDTDKDLVSAVLVTKSGEIISTDPSLVMRTSEDMMQEEWYQEAIHQEAMPVLTPARKELFSHSEDWVVSVTQEITTNQGENIGVLRIDMVYGTLSTYLDRLTLGKEGFAFIVNEKGEFVYHPQKTVYSSKEEMDAMSPYLAIEDGYISQTGPFVYQYRIPDSHWRLVGVASLDELETIRTQIYYSFIGFGLSAFVLSGLVLAFVLRLWIRPIRELQAVILRISSGDNHLRAKEQGAKELIDLSKQFNGMLDQIDELMRLNQEKEQNIRRYELEALASQINPHFLYNTLDTIVWMAEFNAAEKVVGVTKSLAKYFRLALNKGNDQIALKDELDHVRQYLYIQKERYGDQLNYQIDELPAYDHFVLPKLVLQPLVENAIYHGIKEVDRPGMIRISVEDKGSELVVSIHDNGKGLCQQDQTGDIAKLALGGVGLKNVDKRLALEFGPAYHMEIHSEPNTYTLISLHLPKQVK